MTAAHSSAGTRAAKNTLLLVGLRVAMPLLAIALIMAISRLLGAEGLGQFTLAYGFLSILTAIGPLGLNAVVTRDGAQDPSLLERTLANTMTLCAAHGAALTVLMCGIGLLSHYDQATRLAIIILSFAIVPCTIGTLLDGAAMAIERVDQIALGIALEYLIKLGCGIALLLLGFGLELVLAMAVIGKIAACLLQIRLLRRSSVHVRLAYDQSTIRRLLTLIPTFFGISVFATLYWRVDIVMLSWLQSVQEVGYYGAAYRILEVGMILPQSLTMALYPQIASAARHNPSELRKIGNAAMRYLSVIAFPLAICAAILAKPGLKFLYGQDFSPAEPTLSALMFVLIPYGFVRYHAYVLVGANHQKVDLALNVAMLSLNVLLNLLLVPRYSHLGSAVATLIAIILYAFLQWQYLRRKLPGYAATMAISPSLFLVTLVTGATVWFLRSESIAISIGVGCAAYLLMVAASGFFSQRELQLIGLDRLLSRIGVSRS